MTKIIIFFSILILFIHPFKGAFSAEKEHTLHYDVFAGGIHAVKANLTLKISPHSYSAKLEAGTQGFLKSLVPWVGLFESQGWHKKNIFYPKHHHTMSGWKEDLDVKDYRYDRNRNFLGLTHIEDGKDKSPKSIAPALTKGTTDILAATLEVMGKVYNGGLCEGASDVFDGKRRFAMIFKNHGPKQLKKSNSAPFEGPAQECTIEIKPVAGEWSKKPRGWLSIQEQGRKAGTIPTLWMAKIPNINVAVPVKIRVKTNYGTLFMHLTSVE